MSTFASSSPPPPLPVVVAAPPAVVAFFFFFAAPSAARSGAPPSARKMSRTSEIVWSLAFTSCSSLLIGELSIRRSSSCCAPCACCGKSRKSGALRASSSSWSSWRFFCCSSASCASFSRRRASRVCDFLRRLSFLFWSTEVASRCSRSFLSRSWTFALRNSFCFSSEATFARSFSSAPPCATTTWRLSFWRVSAMRSLFFRLRSEAANFLFSCARRPA